MTTPPGRRRPGNLDTNNLIAGPFGFTAQPFFELQDGAQREAPQVKFT